MHIRILVLMALLGSTSLVQAAGPDPHLRVLAASCAACHGFNGNSVGGTPVLAGLDRSHFIVQMQAFRSGARASTVMARHAKGLSEAEIDQLADYFSAQSRRTASAPLPLKGAW
jgi:cytochrome c553